MERVILAACMQCKMKRLLRHVTQRQLFWTPHKALVHLCTRYKAPSHLNYMRTGWLGERESTGSGGREGDGGLGGGDQPEQPEQRVAEAEHATHPPTAAQRPFLLRANSAFQ